MRSGLHLINNGQEQRCCLVNAEPVNKAGLMVIDKLNAGLSQIFTFIYCVAPDFIAAIMYDSPQTAEDFSLPIKDVADL